MQQGFLATREQWGKCYFSAIHLFENEKKDEFFLKLFSSILLSSKFDLPEVEYGSVHKWS